MRRIILLGASNLTYGFPLIAESLRATFDDADLLAALGHGRSYGQFSRVLGRGLPGILQCGLWEALATREQAQSPPLGLITDVGNDLLYGAEPPTILKWVDECAQRLRIVDAALTITGVPLESLKRMSSPRYHATRLCFFPGSGPDWPTMLRMIDELDAGLRQIALQHHGAFVVPRREWYGLDPIHVRRSRRVEGWHEVLGAWPVDEITMQPSVLARVSRLWRLRPAERTMFGRRQQASQPVFVEPGLSLSLY